jgi:PAS domain S-box-containing protein
VTQVLAVAAVAALIALSLALWRLARRLGRVEAARAAARTELDRRLSELFSLQELSYVLSESLQLERIVEQVVRFVMRFLDARGALVVLGGDARTSEHRGPVRVVAAEGTLEAARGRSVPAADPGLVVRALSQDRLEVQAGSATRQVAVLGDITAAGAAAVPLRAHGVVVGALVVTEPRGTTEFQPEDVRLLSTVAIHTAIVLANARFFELIRAAKEQWETAFDALAEGIAVVDADGRIQRANRSLALLLGTSLPAAIGQSLSAALVDRPEALTTLLDAARRGERPPPTTARSETLKRILRITAAPMSERGEDPHAAAVVVLVEDVTDQQALERQLIQNERLAAVGQLVSGVAHELNNPLTSIAGLSEFLLEQPKLGPHDREHLGVIHNQAERAGRIVRNLLTFARKGKAEVAKVDLNDLVQRTLALLTYDLKLKDITVHRHFRRALPEVLGDRYALQQVVLNLMSNAAQAVEGLAPERAREIWVETALEDDEVVFRVRDNGAGIPEADLPHLFEPFFTTKPVGEGTGLGLSISYTIVQNHQGRLTVETHKDGGALFTVRLAVAPADAPRHVSLPDIPAVRYSPQPGGAKRAILLVDDDPAVQRLVAALFGREGHTVEASRSAPEALDLLRQKAYDLVIADLRAATAPGQSFVEAALEVPGVRARLLVATGDVRADADERLARLGVPHLRKPFNLRELREAAAKVWAALAHA